MAWRSNRSSSTTRSPVAVMAATVSRLGWHPPASQPHGRSSRSCQRASRGRGPGRARRSAASRRGAAPDGSPPGPRPDRRPCTAPGRRPLCRSRCPRRVAPRRCRPPLGSAPAPAWPR
jgi:hypothetical protein